MELLVHWYGGRFVDWCYQGMDILTRSHGKPLDIVFDEDHSRIRIDNAPQNFAVIRQMALNLLKNEKTAKGGIQAKRL